MMYTDTLIPVPGKPKEDGSGRLARAFTSEIRKELGDRRMSGRKLASLMNRSETYVRSRLADRADFTINDLESVCEIFDLRASEFLRRAEEQQRS